MRSRWLWRVPQLRSRQRKKETPRSFSELAGKRHRLTLGFRSSLVWEERQGPRAEMIRRNAVITTLTDTSIHSGLAAALSQGVRGTLHQRMPPPPPNAGAGPRVKTEPVLCFGLKTLFFKHDIDSLTLNLWPTAHHPGLSSFPNPRVLSTRLGMASLLLGTRGCTSARG